MRLPNIFRRAPEILPTAAEIFEFTRSHPAPFLRAQAAPCTDCSAKFRPYHATTFWHQGACEAAWRAKAVYPEQEVPRDEHHRQALRRATSPDTPMDALRPATWPEAERARADAWTTQREGVRRLPTDNTRK